MINQEEIFIWFKDLEGHSRIELMCALLDSCLPLELRFLGTYLEYAAGKHYAHLQKWEKDANVCSSFSSITNLSDTKIRRRLCIFLALLHSHNREVAMNLFNILSIYETCVTAFDNSTTDVFNHNGDSESSVKCEFDWSDVTSRNEMKLLLTMASLHPAFDFSQRESLRKKLQNFNIECNLVEASSCASTENVNSKVQVTEKEFEVCPTSSISYKVEQPMTIVSPDMQQSLLPSPPLPVAELRYPLLETFQYSVPMATAFSSPQPLREILIPRQPLPMLNHHEPVPIMNKHANSILKPAQFMSNMNSLPITQPVVVPTSMNLKNTMIPSSHNVPALSISTSEINLMSFNTHGVVDSKTTDKPHEIMKESAHVEYKSKEFDNTVVCSYCPISHNSYSMKNMNNSLHDVRTDSRTLQSSTSTAFSTTKDVPRRCFSESDTDNITFSEISTIHRLQNDFYVTTPRLRTGNPYNHMPRSPVPVYLSFSPHNTIREPSNFQNFPPNLQNHMSTCPMNFRKISPVETTPKNLQTVVTNMLCNSNSMSDPAVANVVPKYNHPNMYLSGGKEIVHSGINGGYIHSHPILVPEPTDIIKSSIYTNDRSLNTMCTDVPYTRSIPSPVKHVLVESNSSAIDSSSLTLNITSHDASESPSVSPTPSPRHFTSPINSPSSQRKSATMFLSAADWLRSLRLHKYSSKFEGYTFQMMQELTDQDLNSLILTVGARKKFKQSVEDLVKRGFKGFGNYASVSDAFFTPSPDSISKSGRRYETTTTSTVSSLPTSPLHNSVPSCLPHHISALSPKKMAACTSSPVFLTQYRKNEESVKLPANDNLFLNVTRNEDEKQQTKKRTHDATCYNCGVAGHYGDDCSETTMEAQTYNRYAFHLDFSTENNTPQDKSSTDETAAPSRIRYELSRDTSQ